MKSFISHALIISVASVLHYLDITYLDSNYIVCATIAASQVVFHNEIKDLVEGA